MELTEVKKIHYKTLWEAVAVCFKLKLWGKVRVVLHDDHYEIEDK